VYGTLQVGGCHHPLVAPFVRRVVPGEVEGRLLDLGAYPGWVEGTGAVRGQMLTLERIAKALGVLDALEDYHGPDHPDNLYRREVAAVHTPAGDLEAWAYRYVGPRRGCPDVPGGWWRPR
jgi:gamma-glutamylcyclotransferase (GGCT)/AIG2-like uncharacterized protein YtfP